MKSLNHCGDRVNYIVQSSGCWFRCTWKPEITEYDVAMWNIKHLTPAEIAEKKADPKGYMERKFGVGEPVNN